MKKRFGFVSNSSSSSFLIYGVCIEPSEIAELYNTVNNTEEDNDELGYKISEELGVEYYNVCDDMCYFGVSASEVGDDETGAEFKKRVRDKMVKYFPDPSNFSYCEEAWENR